MKKSQRRLMDMVTEWATELSKFKGHELLVSQEAAWGFTEVERGRHPDVVLREVIAKITERLPQSVNLSDAHSTPGNLRPPDLSQH